MGIQFKQHLQIFRCWRGFGIWFYYQLYDTGPYPTVKEHRIYKHVPWDSFLKSLKKERSNNVLLMHYIVRILESFWIEYLGSSFRRFKSFYKFEKLKYLKICVRISKKVRSIKWLAFACTISYTWAFLLKIIKYFFSVSAEILVCARSLQSQWVLR